MSSRPEKIMAEVSRTIYMSLRTSDGGEETLPLPGPGGTIRMAVGGPGHRSSMWRVWANPTKDDVYVAARPIAGVQKFSLHESGDWRYQWVTRKGAEAFTGTEDRVIDRWGRPDGNEAGWTKAITVWIPPEGVRPVSEPEEAAAVDVLWLPEPESGTWRGLHVVVAKPSRGFVPVKGATPVAGFSLAGGEVALVLTSELTATPDQVQWLKRNARAALESAIEGGILPEQLARGDTRLGLFGNLKDDQRFVVEVAVENVGEARASNLT